MLRRRRRGEVPSLSNDWPPTTPRTTLLTAGNTPAPSASTVIDLRDGIGWVAGIESDPARRADLAERFRERRARAEASADLQRLRARHWSGERIVEESRFDTEWWRHSEADPYAVLELLPGAALDEVAAARRRIAKACHPDADYPTETARDDARERMIAANSAYDRIRRALRV